MADRFRETGSRSVAVGDVATLLGKSVSWIKRLRNGSADVIVALHDGMNIAVAYDRLCTRIEARRDREGPRGRPAEEHRCGCVEHSGPGGRQGARAA